MYKQWSTAFFLGTSLWLGFVSHASAEADPKLWGVVKEAYFGQRPMQEVDFIKIEAPRRAESGAQVPVSYHIDNAAANGAVIKNVYVFVDANPIPLAATFHLTDVLGNFSLATRIRFETDAFVRLVGETADGKLYLASREIRAAGGCGGTVDGNEAEIRASAGKIKLNVATPVKFGEPTATTFIIKHPMRTGLQRDLVSQGFVPAFYINKATFTFNGNPVMSIDIGVGTSEDPYFKFDFIPSTPGVLEVKATDNEGKEFSHSIDIKA